MAETEVELCRRALRRIGVTVTVNSLDDATVEARACKEIYARTRDALLEAFPWPRATKTTSLPRVSDYTPLRYAYAYTLPLDCLLVREIWTGAVRTQREDMIPFGLEIVGDATVLVTDHEAPQIIYTARVEDLGKWPALRAKALEWGLAVELALALPNRLDQAENARRQYAMALHLAADRELNSEQLPVEPDSELVRGGV